LLSDATPLTTKKQNLNSYSPTTGTRQMSPSSSPMTHNAQNVRNRPSNGYVLKLFYLHMWSNNALLTKKPDTNLKYFNLNIYLENPIEKSFLFLLRLIALEGSRELENIIGVSDMSCVLSAEVQKTELLTKDFNLCVSTFRKLFILTPSQRFLGHVNPQQQNVHSYFSSQLPL
uniref:Uncharacterized protein n=1 Tax=Buteo japonicus TaxID=224669 RepID=A0A8C0HSL6_9AVES